MNSFFGITLFLGVRSGLFGWGESPDSPDVFGLVELRMDEHDWFNGLMNVLTEQTPANYNPRPHMVM
jgi:hypothetical protein